MLTGGKRADDPAGGLRGGFFFEPTVLVDATKDMNVFKAEIFGPITPVFKFSSEEEVIDLANSSELGLAAYFYTENLKRSWRVAKALEYGMIGVNQVAITSEVAPFGGWKHSGLGREHSKYGALTSADTRSRALAPDSLTRATRHVLRSFARYGIDEYLEKKTVCIGLR